MAGDSNNEQPKAQQQSNDNNGSAAPKADETNKSQLNDSLISSSVSPRDDNSHAEKCNRCDRAIRKFEDTIRCSNFAQHCDRVYHRRCVLPYSATGDLNDDRWRCEHCYVVRPVENLTIKERYVSASPVRTSVLDDSSFEYRLRDGRTHVCKNPNCPQVGYATKSYSKVKSASSDYVLTRPVELVEDRVVVTDLDSSRYYRQPNYEYVVREEAPATTYKTYSYVEPQVELVPAHVERVEITEIAQGIDERVRHREPIVEKVVEVRRPEPVVEKIVEVRRPEPVVEKIVEVRRPEPVVEKIVEVRRPEPVVEVRRPEVYTYAVVDDTHVQDAHEFFYYATDDDKRVVETVETCKHQCRVHQPRYYTYEKSPKVTHKSTVSYDIPLTVQVPNTTTKKITTKQIQVNGVDSDKYRLMERQLNEQASKLRSQEDRIGELTTYLRRLESEPPKQRNKLSAIVDNFLNENKQKPEDRSKSTIVSLTNRAPPSSTVPRIQINAPAVPRLNLNETNVYDSLSSNKKGNLTRSEINLRVDDNLDGRNTISSRISDKYLTDSYRTGSLERSSSALATVYDANRSKDGIYEYVRPIAPNAVAKPSYKGYLERIRFDKILFITEKLYCVVDGCLMHVYKKPSDKRQSKSYKLTGVKVRTPEDIQNELKLSLGTKRVQHNLKHPRSFEVQWKNGKSYQFVVPKDGDFTLWVNALRSASAVDSQLNFDQKGF